MRITYEINTEGVAAIFDVLRHDPLQPQRINMTNVAKRIKYTPAAVHGSVEMLTNHQMLFTRKDGKSLLFSLYPFNTLDLK